MTAASNRVPRKRRSRSPERGRAARARAQPGPAGDTGPQADLPRNATRRASGQARRRATWTNARGGPRSPWSRAGAANCGDTSNYGSLSTAPWCSAATAAGAREGRCARQARHIHASHVAVREEEFSGQKHIQRRCSGPPRPSAAQEPRKMGHGFSAAARSHWEPAPAAGR